MTQRKLPHFLTKEKETVNILMISKREKMIYFPYTICLHDGITYDMDNLEKWMIYDTDFYLLANKQLASRIISAGADLESDVAREFCA